MKRKQSQKVFRLSDEQRKEQQALSCPLSSGSIVCVGAILISLAIVAGIISLAIWINSYRRIQDSYTTYATSVNKVLEEVYESESTPQPTSQPQPPQQSTAQQSQPQQPTAQQSQSQQPIVINNNIYVSDNAQVITSED